LTASGGKPSSLPLEGIKILDLGTMTPGKYCTFILADLGAEVIRVERPVPRANSIDDEDLILNRNKRSLTLNLKEKQAKQIFLKLAQGADVILESQRPGSTARLGVDYESIREINPAIIYVSLSGFGQDGPYSQLPGFDMIFLALGGLLGLLGGKNNPPVVPGIWISDACSGLLAVVGILTALIARQNKGKGQYLDLAMLDSVLYLLATVSGFRKSSGEFAQEDMMNNPVSPGYNIYETADGKYLALGTFRPQSWRTLCQALDRSDLIDQQWAAGDKRVETISILQETFRTKNRDEWYQQLRDLDIEVAPVNSLREAFNNPQVLHRQMVMDVKHPIAGQIHQIGQPFKFSETPGQIKQLAPYIGQHTDAILMEIGYSESEIREFRAAEVI
jgi:crotonobetainyl-CoA:carnitine CoA-transferase CaiB-like acyl-CoA transferase